jgi:class 3 adenylate cyclase
MPKLEFSSHKSTAHKAIVASFDLGGFSDFCNQPEASKAAPRLAKLVFDVLNTHFTEPTEVGFFSTDLKPGELPAPSFIKFTGDGALMLWLLKDELPDFPQEFCNLVVEKMRQFQTRLAQDLPSCEREWHVSKLPRRVRVGISTGVVYALRTPHVITSLKEPCDYVGYCINLAVRLQDHCRELGFLAHGVLHPELPGMEARTALKLKGSQNEPVFLFTEDISQVPQSEFNRKFGPSPA